ncbi:hypothetical protein MCAP1_001255 [Malassezia caprae]|uniref:Uncharacterized protein n=1 Tax=Malassezia caprae TaxID=1381934 RepID=A0AAF0E614_9BASI|nr:hypothetical protein MCAP1_001255 [Malassezia caprae]
MQRPVLSPTLAFHEAREVCADLAALYAASELSMTMPEAAPTGSLGHIPDHELVRVRLHLRLPSLPSRLPPPQAADEAVTALDPESKQRLPPRLAALVTALQLRLRSTEPSTPMGLYTWQGMEPRTDFCVRCQSVQDELLASISPFSDETELSGIVYDTATKAWHIHWHCDLYMQHWRYTVATVRIQADLHLRLDIGTWAAHADAPRPQTPYHYTAHSVHPCAASDDPYMIEADLLSELASSVKVPDETPEQRHEHLSSQLTLLPSSMLMPGVLGSDVVSPWSEAIQLEERMRRAKELEAAALATDADIALTSWTTPPKPKPGGMQRSASQPSSSESPAVDRTINVPTLALGGPVALCRAAHLDVTLESMIGRQLQQSGSPFRTPRGTCATLLEVKIQNSSKDTPFVLHKVSIHMGSAIQGLADPFADTDDVRIVVEPLDPPSMYPMHVQPGILLTLLFEAHVECPHMDADQALAALTAWPASRHARVVIHGTPMRGAPTTQVTFVTDYNRSISVRLSQLDLQRAAIAEQAVRRATGATDAVLPVPALRAAPSDAAPPPPPKPWRAPSGMFRPSQAVAHTHRAYAWSKVDVFAEGCDPNEMASAMASLHGSLLATVDVSQHAPTLGLARVQLHVSLLHLSKEDMDLEVQWHPDSESASPGAVLPEQTSVRGTTCWATWAL